MKSEANSKARRKHRMWTPYFVLFVALLVTLLAASYVARTAESKDRLRFQNAVNHTHNNIRKRLDIYLALLQSGAGLFTASDEVTRDEFRNYVDQLELRTNYPGIQGIGFTVRLKPEERDALAAKMRAQGLKSFHLWPAEPARSEYHSIIYLEPFDRRNQAAIGFDMFTEPVRREAMERARDAGAAAASGRVTLVQEIDQDKQAGFLIYVPVYQGGPPPATESERRAALRGFIYSPFRADDLLDGILAKESQEGIDFEVYEGQDTGPENLLHNSRRANLAASSEQAPRFTARTELDVAGRKWNLVYATGQGFEAGSGMNLVPYTLLGGTLISLLLFLVTGSQARARASAERSAAELKQSEAALRESEERYRVFVEQSTEGIWRFELEMPCPLEMSEDEQLAHFYKYGYLAECNDAMAQMYGYERAGEIVGARLGDLLVQDDPANIAYLRSFIRAGYRLSDAESHELDREGNRKYIVNNLIGVIEHGRLLRAWGTQRDITKRKQAEERLRYQLELNSTITSNAAEALFLLDAEWRTTFVNPAAEEIFGWKREEFLGKNLHELVHYRRPDGTPFPISECPIGAVFKQGQTVREHEDIFIRKDGTFIPVSYSNAPIIVNGQVTGAVLTVHDITERRQAEAALRVADQRALAEYERLIERINNLAQSLGTARDLLTIFRALREFALLSVPCIGIFISLYDPQRDVRTCAYGWGDGIEFDVSELPPMPITSTGPNSVAVRTGEVIITDDYISATRGHPSVVVGPDNGLRPQSSLVVPMAVMSRIIGTIEVQSYERAAYRAEHSTALLMAANLAAIAVENVRLLEHESRARAVAEESNRMKDEFLATVSHELRTPLTSILGWSNMLSTGLLDEATARVALETIERNARAQAQIIDDILDVSRIITGKLILDVKPVELGPVIEAAINAVRPAANAKSIQLETLFDTGVGPVPGDASRLQQVVWNLLSNAVKFTPRGGRVLVSLRQTPNNIEISVSDTGPGISPEFLPFVFERFRQADSTTTRRHGGLGLGLAIVRHMVELHGGTVQAESKSEGEGANFTVKLPLACAVPDALSAEAATREGATDLSSPWSNRSLLEGVHVLLVDDDQDTLTVLSAILERRLMKVTAVNSANAAIEALESSRPHILVADIGMPEIDGYELIRRIRTLSSEQGGNIPAVALTAYAREDDRQRSLDAGYQQHLSKPVDPSELLATISLLTKRSGKISGNGNNDS